MFNHHTQVTGHQVLLPAHVFSEIFSLLRYESSYSPEVLSRTSTLVLTGAEVVPLSHVCRRWRHIALRSPKLWTSFRSRDLTRMFPTFVERDQGAPVDVSVCIDSHEYPSKSHQISESASTLTPKNMYHMMYVVNLNLQNHSLESISMAIFLNISSSCHFSIRPAGFTPNAPQMILPLLFNVGGTSLCQQAQTSQSRPVDRAIRPRHTHLEISPTLCSDASCHQRRVLRPTVKANNSATSGLSCGTGIHAIRPTVQLNGEPATQILDTLCWERHDTITLSAVFGIHEATNS